MFDWIEITGLRRKIHNNQHTMVFFPLQIFPTELRGVFELLSCCKTNP